MQIPPTQKHLTPKNPAMPTSQLDKQSDRLFAKSEANKVAKSQADVAPSDRIQDRMMEEPERWDGLS